MKKIAIKMENGLCWGVAGMLVVGIVCVILLTNVWEQGGKIIEEVNE